MQPTVSHSLKVSVDHFMKHIFMFHSSFSGPATAGPPQSLLQLRYSPEMAGLGCDMAKIAPDQLFSLCYSIPGKLTPVEGVGQSPQAPLL